MTIKSEYKKNQNMTKLIIKGRPVTKKNHCQIIRNRNTGRPMLIQSPQYRQYEKEFIKQMDENLKGLFDAEVQLHMRALYYFPDRRGKADLVNLIQATQDILQKFGLYNNDSQIKSLDGSRIVGIDKDNPRVEIEIEAITKAD
ncbi:Holliday junction resolvase RusA-like endonuclease [Sporomusaceae bacterium BoRhaA]|uniref:RusA family crossover junction endodeoxyribonuclease n=1 Tax=Pelorhabdus rhamnosifermentans TaxID=2772457 RepID=UPI001C0615D3|nr:RusA family crossover junction endodeoxyribonuclease [Pelorhabdus rhamnosifermentans]MBU2700453.1 Holliday junction resolvase RusA-like endonuclease [Pelorhabdus rhamnosifermentans]